MAEKPAVTLGQWIAIGPNLRAVVCTIYENENVEVVYIDHKGKAINEDAKWTGETWDFVIQGPCGGYADNSPRLQTYVGILRSGRR